MSTARSDNCPNPGRSAVAVDTAKDAEAVAELSRKLGERYQLVRRLATGGMAEIFLAKQRSLAGFEKQFVVKLLQRRYCGDQRVVEMFLDEACIGAMFNHPNIIHVYDLGEVDGMPYIAMEYVDGQELSTLCRRGLELEAFLPVEHAVDLMRQAAEGMGYFHAKRDEQNEPLGIIHRDISPSNLLVTREGVLKIIDFGIACSFRARSNDDTLRPGKCHYMSPEQARKEQVDHRSDVFSLGIVLYEITVGKRLFKGRPDEVLQRISRQRVKPPTFVRKGFPPALEAIILKALEQHPDDRYDNAYQMAADLEAYSRESGLCSGPVWIARYLDALEGKAGSEQRAELLFAGEAWVDDEGDDALELDRVFAEMVKRPSS
ncbi:MAG: serine/threonine-protein kinase [Pseudomonadota bacterium]